MKIIVNGAGLSCADFLYTGLDFNSPEFKRYVTRKPGDGGISIGHLVFLADLLAFAGQPLDTIRKTQGWLREVDRFSIGGPCIVGLANAAQLVKGGMAPDGESYVFRYYGALAKDKVADRMMSVLNQIPQLDLSRQIYIDEKGIESPYTLVLSDQNFADGSGERSFVLNPGTSHAYKPEMLGDEFFDAHIVFFSGTASVRHIHNKLTTLLKKAKSKGCITMVGTVFDFWNEKLNPGKRWPLGESDESYAFIDLLVVDFVEAQRLSGHDDLQEAIQFFIKKGVATFIVTNGDSEGYAWSSGKLFAKLPLTPFTVCKSVVKELKEKPELRGDTTGCGDNFAGGLLASLAAQLGAEKPKGSLSLLEALAWANASGGFCCYSVGGTYLEKSKGEKYRKVRRIQQQYIAQLKQESKL